MVPLSGYILVWSDEFNGIILDTNKWVKYGLSTDVVVQNSNLIIGPSSCGVKACSMVDWSNCISSTIKHKFKYGYFEMRARLAGPYTGATNDGFSSQIWLYLLNKQNRTGPGQEINLTETSSGPIKLDSSFNGINKMNWSIHCGVSEDGTKFNTCVPSNNPSRSSAYRCKDENGIDIDLSKDYHLYACEWTSTYVKYYFDNKYIGQYVKDLNRYCIDPDGVKSVLCIPQIDMQIVLGLANGGSWPATQKPGTGNAKLYIDYVKVYQLGTDLCQNPVLSMTIS